MLTPIFDSDFDFDTDMRPEPPW